MLYVHLWFSDHLSQCLIGNISKNNTQLEIESIEVKSSKKDTIIELFTYKDEKLEQWFVRTN